MILSLLLTDKVATTSECVHYNHYNIYNTTSKLKIFNKNCKGLGTTKKEKKQEETQTGDDNTVP